MIYFILQEKGGVGKSYTTKLLTLKADKEKIKTHFIDCDNASASLTKFFKGIEERKSPYILYKSVNLLGTDKKIDRTKFDSFLGTLEQLDNVVIDYGAASSEQVFYYIQEEQKNGILDVFEEMGIQILVIMAGGGMIKESIDFFMKLKQIKGIEKFITIVANEKEGGVYGKSVQEYTKADIQIKSLHEDSNSEAQREWGDLLNSGIVYSDIQGMSVIRKKRIISYLDSIFSQFKFKSNDQIRTNKSS